VTPLEGNSTKLAQEKIIVKEGCVNPDHLSWLMSTEYNGTRGVDISYRRSVLQKCHLPMTG